MAAKAKAKGKAAKATKAKAKTKVKKAKKPTVGMTAQQVKKFQAAAKKVTTQQRIAASAARTQKRRLATARRVTAISRRSYQAAAASRAVAYATRQTSRQANAQHLSSATRRAAAARVFNATRIASSRKFVALGEATHAHTSVMQTMTNSQALANQTRISQKAAATARTNAKKKAAAFKKLKAQGKISKSAKTVPKGYGINAKGQLYKTKVKKKGKSPAKPKKKAGYSPAAIAAGLKAAGPISKQTRKQKLSMSKGSKTKAQQASQSKKAAVKVKAKPKASVVTPRVNVSDWITTGNDQGAENCLPVAIANHLYAWTGYKMADDQVEEIKGDTVYDALELLKTASPFENVRVAEFAQLTQRHHDIPGSLIVFNPPEGCHAGVLLPNWKVVSYGEVIKLESEVEEAYYVRWEVADIED